MARLSRKIFQGPALFSYGFRPFFLLALGFATLIIPIWMAAYSGQLYLHSPFAPLDWHIHEMIFGYAAAVISGFLFTAIPNWTGRMPVRGWPLVMLGLLWAAGRLAVAGFGGFGTGLVMLIDCSFLTAISVMVAVEIIAGRNWRNLKILVPVVALLIANIQFHTEVLANGATEYGRRAGIAVVIFLIMLIGGRIIPSFTRNWLAKSNTSPLPVPFGRFDAICLVASSAALLLWVIAPDLSVTGWGLISTAFLNMVRLQRWRGYRTLASPILLMLHGAFFFIPAGQFALGIGNATAGFHLLGIGAIGGMTMAVMIRATMGHTGRGLNNDRWLTCAFVFLLAAAIMRSFLPHFQIAAAPSLMVAAGFWTIGFGIVLARIGPWLLTANLQRRTTS